MVDLNRRPRRQLELDGRFREADEIKAEAEGQVKSILVENAQPVEYGQLLFELEPVDGRPPIL